MGDNEKAASVALPSHFVDRKARRWDLFFTWADLLKLKREAGIDIDEMIPRSKAKADSATDASLAAFHDFITDGSALFLSLWLILSAQCERLGITQVDFAEGFDGPTFEAAGLAFTGALVNFFPNGVRKTIAMKTWQKGREIMTEQARRLGEEIDKIDAAKEVNRAVDAALKKQSGTPPVPPG